MASECDNFVKPGGSSPFFCPYLPIFAHWAKQDFQKWWDFGQKWAKNGQKWAKFIDSFCVKFAGIL